MSPYRCSRLSPLGGDERDRTDDPLLAKQVLSQLSYTPILLECSCEPQKLNNEIKVLDNLTLDVKQLLFQTVRSP